jgi:hypothetical protein
VLYHDRSPGGLYLPCPTLYKPGFSWPIGGEDSVPSISVVDDGGDDRTFFNSQATFTNKSCTGPVCYIMVVWTSIGTVQLNSCTFDGNSADIEVRDTGPGPSINNCGAAICSIDDAQFGSLVFNFGGIILSCAFRLISAENVKTRAASDTDEYGSTASNITLSALTEPDNGGLEIASMVSYNNTTSITWTPNPEVVEFYDEGVGGGVRFSIGYRIGGTGTGDIKWTGALAGQCTVGIAVR